MNKIEVPDVYDHVNKVWPQDAGAPTPAEAITAAKILYRVAVGRKFRGPFKLTSGNRYTWVYRGTLRVNPNRRGWYRGWKALVHDLSHLCHRRLHPDDRPHSDRHAYLERRLAEYVVSHGWLDGKLKRKRTEKPARNLIGERYGRIVARERRWQAKLRRAQNALKKVRRERRDYERRHGERLEA